MMSSETVLIKEVALGASSMLLVQLNRPERLNALNWEMIRALNNLLDLAEDPVRQVRLLLFSGSGRAFCAGADILDLSAAAAERGTAASADFLGAEYAMLARVRNLGIPTIAVADGPTVGAGAGLFMACKIRVATPNTVFAMPETNIGLVPDVGSTHFLTRTPGSLGMYLALTATRLSHNELTLFNLSTHTLPSRAIPELLSLSFLSPAVALTTPSLSQLLRSRLPPSPPSPTPLTTPDSPTRRAIDRIFSAPNLRDLLTRLGAERGAWAAATFAALRTACPTALVLTFDLMRIAYAAPAPGEPAWVAAMDRERKANVWLAARPDFGEGVRCTLKDKLDKPRWNPPSVDQVTDTGEWIRASM